jgi:Terminase large subunit, T4likevirus-type, N-terminal
MINTSNTSLLSQLSLDLAASINPVTLAEVALGYDCDDWQRKLLLDSKSKRILLLAARQVGKSFCVSLAALATALNNENSLILCLSSSQRQSSELFKRIISIYRQLPNPMPYVALSESQLRLSNQSRILSLPSSESTIRGYSGVDLLLIDEAARVSSGLYYSAIPMLATKPDSRLIALSTPSAKKGWFYDAFTSNDPAWQRYTITADQCPRISKEFLAQQKATMPSYVYESEFECKWLDSDTTLFRADIIARSIRDFDELDLDLGDAMASELEPSQFINDFELE